MLRLLDTILYILQILDLFQTSAAWEIYLIETHLQYIGRSTVFLLSLRAALTLKALPSPPRAPVSSQPAAGGRGGT